MYVEVGQRLSEARQKRKLTLVDIARSTKIPVHYLEAIERDDAEHMPRGFFARAFVRTYATEVGLNPGELLDSVDQPESAPPEPDVTSIPVFVDEPASGRSLFLVIPVGLLACGLYVGFGATKTPAEAPQVAAEIPMATDDRVEPAAVAAPLAATDVALQIQSSGGCIFTVTADGHPIASQATPEGEPIVLKARGEVVLRVGDSSVCPPAVKPAAIPKPSRRVKVDAAPQSPAAVDQQSEAAATAREPVPSASDVVLPPPDPSTPPAATNQP